MAFAQTYYWTVGKPVDSAYDEVYWEPTGTYTGSLPPGISFNAGFDDMAMVGFIEFSGTPTTAGTYTATFISYTSGGNRTLQFIVADASAKVRVNVNGSWVTGTVYVNVNGTWTKAKKVYVNVNGSWVEGH